MYIIFVVRLVVHFLLHRRQICLGFASSPDLSVGCVAASRFAFMSSVTNSG
jgi:hypothetical protein